ncbi:MAG: TonB-dependent outer membrane receptorprecursor [Bacteroidetes bacterium]|nr:MAG: TonB-dependent outer membrane receptorprecursor [Bacteroidota bacterium]
MSRIITLLCFFLFAACPLLAQQPVSGLVRNKATNEPVIGANVRTADNKYLASTSIEGVYTLTLPDGDYTISVSYVGYRAVSAKIKIAGKPVKLDFLLENITLDEVEISADIAIDRKTPVAFSNIGEIKLQQELGPRDLSMVINSTPGAYATEQGGGSGDSRINLRGFDQRNIAVMVDGVPVNDMENGWVYWSNWDGLGDVTRNMQVQRGLGASKLALPSVGGTINIITKGLDQKQGFVIKKEMGSNGYDKTSFGFNSGKVGKGWGLTMAGSRKTGNGWADETWTDAWSYFIKVQKRFDKHTLTLGANGAPQYHGQRTERMPIAVYNRGFVRELIAKDLDGEIGTGTYNLTGEATQSYIDSVTNASMVSGAYTTVTQGDRGPQYNPGWGELTTPNGTGKLNERVNFYHKPQINFSHFWSANEKLYISTVLYASFGYGGGTGSNTSLGRDTTTGQLLFTTAYNSNIANFDLLYSTTEHKSTRYIRSSMNDHRWYGGLVTANWSPVKRLNFLLGLDARYYKGIHYRIVYDLLGGDYVTDFSDKNQPNGVGNLSYAMKRRGDKITYYNDAYVTWGGAFTQAEYQADRWSTFLTFTGSQTSYQRRDYFRKRDIVLEDGEVIPMIVGYNEIYYTTGSQSGVAQNGATVTTSGDTTFINNPVGTDYTMVGAKAYAWDSEYARTASTDQKKLPGFTVKGGFNFNIDEHMNVFINAGYMNMAPRFNNVFDNNNKELLDIKNQKVYAVEFGYGFRYKKIAANINGYYTYWYNKPPAFAPTIIIAGDPFTYNVNGMTSQHYGAEFDFNWRPVNRFSIEGAMSLGNWTFQSAKEVFIYDQNEILVDSVEFSAVGVHVGDAAQTQVSLGLRYEPNKRLYLKSQLTYFARYYSDIDPISLAVDYDAQGNVLYDNRDRESWRLPSYMLIDFFTGYEFKPFEAGDRKFKLSVNGTIFNLLGTEYVSDAQTGGKFDAATALVYMGQGRRFTAGLRFSF